VFLAKNKLKELHSVALRIFLKNIAEFEQFTARVSEFFLLTH